MSSIKNSELVLDTFQTVELKARLNKYNLFLDTLYNDDYGFLREAVKTCVLYLIDERFKTQRDLAVKNFHERSVLKNNHKNEGNYLSKFRLADKKACSLDLATGSGKSYLMFGIAVVMLCEEKVKNVLVLCPSTTIENELIEKFKTLMSQGILTELLEGVNPNFSPPSIKKADVTIGHNQICIENIHAVYDTTGSSIPKSFGDEKGKNTLVLNDEAHHVFSESLDNKLKNWFKFLNHADNAFHYIVNVTGTPYCESDQDNYFRDVIYRFPLKEAMERGIVKHVDSRYLDDNQSEMYAFEQIIAVHEKKREKFGDYVRPLSIIVCDQITTAIFEWDEWVKRIATYEKISIAEAREKVIWVTSGLPSKTSLEKTPKVATILKELEGGTKWLNKYNETLKTVDDKDSPVEWIISVAKLTEGWDVKRVFQIVPHEKKAFNSRLLISQVLGRGLRVPPSVKAAFKKEEITVTVNNHPNWFQDIKDLYEEVLEIKERGSWGYDAGKDIYDIKLYNLHYESKVTGSQTTGAPEAFSGKFNFKQQKKEHKATASFMDLKDVSRKEHLAYVYQERETRTIGLAAQELFNYIEAHDPTPDKTLTSQFSRKNLIETIKKELEDNQWDSSFLSKENFIQAQYALGPLFRRAGETVGVYENTADRCDPLSMTTFSKQSFNESSLQKEGYFYYDDNTLSWYENEDERIWVQKHVNIADSIAEIVANMGKATDVEEMTKLSKELTNLNLMKQRFIKIPKAQFKTPLNAVYVSYQPEKMFMTYLTEQHSDKIDWFIKSPDKGFYSLKYQHQEAGSTHSKTHAFNPDFFLKVCGKNDIIVVEIKSKDDLNAKNAAKQRDAKRHFEDLNNLLSEEGIEQRYYFKFLSDDGNDIGDFFQSLSSGEYPNWASKLMRDLEKTNG